MTDKLKLDICNCGKLKCIECNKLLCLHCKQLICNYCKVYDKYTTKFYCNKCYSKLGIEEYNFNYI